MTNYVYLRKTSSISLQSEELNEFGWVCKAQKWKLNK